MSDEVRQIQKASWLFTGLALFTVSMFFFGAPSIGFLSPKLMMWTALLAGMVAGIGAIQCVIYLRRRKLPLPSITIAAVIIGSVTLSGSALVVAYIFHGMATCHNFPVGC
jgi:hypothetical protein